MAVSKFTSFSECLQVIKVKKPVLLIVSIEFSEIWESMEHISGVEGYGRIPVIIIGTRKELADSTQLISSRNFAQVPKAIRTSLLVETIESEIRKSNLVDMRPLELKKGDYLFKEGDDSSTIFILKSGKVKVYRREDDREIEIAEIVDSGLIGEMSFIDKRPRSASVVALEESKVLEVNLKDFDLYLESQPFWLSLILNTLIERLRKANIRLS